MSLHTITCKTCSKSFISQRKKPPKFCSVACRHKGQIIGGLWFHRQLFFCPICLTEFKLLRPRLRAGTCGKKCGIILWKLRQPKCIKKPKKRYRKPPQALRHFHCAFCNKLVASVTRKRFCSDKCSQTVGFRASRHVKRARIRQAVVKDRIDLPTLLKRDNFCCGICGKKIRQKYQWPHPLAASHDHIMPLSRGGDHSWANAQAAHFGCNMQKRYATQGQFRLF